MEDFPIKLVPPEGFRAAPSEGGGTRIYVIEGTSGSGGALLVSSIAGIEADQLPADIAALIRRTHKDVVVRNVGATEVDGRPAQAFTLDQKPGTAPRDLSCARTGTCFKLLGTKPMDMTVVRHPQGVVLFAVEYLPEDRATVRRSMQDFLASVRWE